MLSVEMLPRKKLEEHFKQYVDDIHSGAMWSVKCYSTFLNLIQEKNFKEVCIYGVGFGTHAEFLLKNTNLKNLRLADRMDGTEPNVFTSAVNNLEPKIPGQQFEEVIGLVDGLLAPYSSRYVWYKKSYNDLSEIIDGSLNCIFIDTYYNPADIEKIYLALIFKIAPGGMLISDGYSNPSEKAAVDAFCKKYSKTLTFYEIPSAGYQLYCINV